MSGRLLVGIQADDLTGACDAGAPFASRGLSTVVLFAETPLPSPAPDVLVLDSESRDLPADEARAQARVAGERLAARAPAILYKKVDSTLRGAIAAELLGILEGAGRPAVVLAPAFPAQGRSIVDGHLRLRASRAADAGVAHGSVLALLGGSGLGPVVLVPLTAVRAGAAAVAARLSRFRAAFVCDAETDADLAVLAAATASGPALLAGSAGFAAALAARLPLTGARLPPPLRRPLLVIAGSPHPTTRAQVVRLEAARAAVSILAAPDRAASADPAIRRAVAEGLAETTRRRLAGHGLPGTLLLTGGETAVSVCRALGATGLALRDEVEPGLAVGTLLDGPCAGLVVVTKAGGFGDPETLVRIHERCA